MTIDQFCSALGFGDAVKFRLEPDWTRLFSSWNGKVPEYVSLDYFNRVYPHLNGPESGMVASRVEAVAAICRKNPAAAFYMHMLAYGAFTATPGMNFGFLTPALPFGENDGVANLLAAMSAAPAIERNCRRRGIPERYATEVLKWIGGSVAIYAAGHNGTPGHALTQLYWIRHYVDGTIYRIGRFEYLMHPVPEWVPAIYRHDDGRIAVLCRPGIRLDDAGLTARSDAPEEAVALTTSLVESKGKIAGTPISPEGFARVGERLSLELEHWRPVCSPWDLVPSIHIPGGERMTPEAAIDSMIQAREFFKRYFQREVPLFVCNSWIFNPMWQKLAPESNMARFQREVHLAPGWPPSGRDGMFFVFGRGDVDPVDLPAVNSAQKLLQEAFRQEGTLRTEAMFVLCDDLEKLGNQYYRRSGITADEPR